MSERINLHVTCYSLSLQYMPDLEHQRIIQRLKQYGISSTGSKSQDLSILRDIEYKEAQNENCISTKFLTVTKAEQEKIQKRKKEKNEEVNPEACLNSMNGQKILGEQLFLTHKIKNRKEI